MPARSRFLVEDHGDLPGVNRADGRFQLGPAGAKFLVSLADPVEEVEEDGVAAATGAVIIQEPHAFQPEGLAVFLHVVGLLPDQVRGAERPAAVFALSDHDAPSNSGVTNNHARMFGKGRAEPG